MQKKMNAVMNSITGTDFHTLKTIISLQYRKFIRFYRLVEEYIDYIDDIQYEFLSPDSLDLSCTFIDKKDAKSAVSVIENAMKANNYDGTIKMKKDTLYITLILKEEDEIEEEDENPVTETEESDKNSDTL